MKLQFFEERTEDSLRSRVAQSELQSARENGSYDTLHIDPYFLVSFLLVGQANDLI